jgi:membrane protein implicated in regulation of membrane protease activity
MTFALGVVLIAVIVVAVLFMINGIGLFAPSKRPRPQDDPEVLTGLIARVTSAISAAAAGMVAYTVEGTRREVAARSVDGSAIQAGADVVIDRIDDGTAFVERWETVEGRL